MAVTRSEVVEVDLDVEAGAQLDVGVLLVDVDNHPEVKVDILGELLPVFGRTDEAVSLDRVQVEDTGLDGGFTGTLFAETFRNEIFLKL